MSFLLVPPPQVPSSDVPHISISVVVLGLLGLSWLWSPSATCSGPYWVKVEISNITKKFITILGFKTHRTVHNAEKENTF